MKFTKAARNKKLKHPRIAVEVTVEEFGNGIPIADVVAWLERSTDHDNISQVFQVYPVVRIKASDGMCRVVIDGEKTEGSVMSIGVGFGYSTVSHALSALRTDIKVSNVVYPRPRYALQLLPDKTPYHE
ncbi:unnamed protein product [Phytophthora fragariaefolia]|uniref:Unnamed protein product n=1 Tax=Phytophthora fragariaefolia TaxID=1490495 RepID=A0A9W6YG28_9STRA|nr:unnamed protein product [Phytophthora fragariaefolia]